MLAESTAVDAANMVTSTHDLAAAFRSVGPSDTAVAREALIGIYLNNGQEKSNSWKLDGDQLTLTATPEQQDDFARLVDDLESIGLWQVTIETQFIRADEGFAPQVGIDWDRATRVFRPDIINYPVPRKMSTLQAQDGLLLQAETVTHSFAPHMAAA